MSTSLHAARGMAIVVMLLMTVAPLPGQSTPEALAHELVRAIRQSDVKMLEALVHPSVREAVGSSQVRQAVESWLDRDLTDDVRIEVKSAADVKEYDPANRTFNFGGLRMTFPVAPTHFVALITEEEARLRTSGEAQSVLVRGPVALDAIRYDFGRWWIVFPGLGPSRP